MLTRHLIYQEYRTEGEGLQPTETKKDQKAPSCDSSKENQEDTKRKKEKRKRAAEDGWDLVESIQQLAEVILRVEQMRTEAMREVEKIRAETEEKKGEMDLKRTEIVANTQLQIAKLFARSRDKVIS